MEAMLTYSRRDNHMPGSMAYTNGFAIASEPRIVGV